MRKIECLEIRTYEVLGVKHFRKLVFALERLIHKRDKGHNINYHIPHQDIESFDAFVKYLFYNGAIHVRNILAILLYFFCKMVWFHHLHWFDLIVAVFLIKDIYCVILQRYNYLRIKKRKEVLIIKRNEKIAREVAKIDISAVEDYSYAQIKQDLQLVRRLRDGIYGRHSVVLSDEDIGRLNRLSYLLDSRNQQKT